MCGTELYSNSVTVRREKSSSQHCRSELLAYVLLESILTFLLINLCLCGCQFNGTHSQLFSLAAPRDILPFFFSYLTVLLPVCETPFFRLFIYTAASFYDTPSRGPHPPKPSKRIMLAPRFLVSPSASQRIIKSRLSFLMKRTLCVERAC